MEATVGDEDDEEEEDEGYGMSEDEELSEAELPTVSDYLRRMPARKAVEEEEFDAAAEVERIKKVHGGRRYQDAVSMEAAIPRSAVMMPKATDPKLWLVKCRPGKEREAVASLTRGLLELDRSGQEVPQVFSAVSRDSLKGYIYIESYKPADITAAIQRLRLTHLIFASMMTRPSLVPMAEMADVLAPGKVKETAGQEAISPGDWALVKRGKYAGDLAQVIEVPEDLSPNDPSVMVRIKILPRLSFRRSASERPPARPFDPQEASQYGAVTKSRGFWVYAQEFYKDGFLVKEVRLGSLQIGSAVTPRPDELERFGVSGQSEEQQAPSQPVAFVKGDRVIVTEGDLKGITGSVDSVTDAKSGWVTVALEHKDLKEPVTLKTDQLARHFELGQSVRIVRGPNAGQSGMVVDMEEDWANLTLLVLATQQQLTISAGAVQDLNAAPVAALPRKSDVDGIELNDLVQTVDVDPVFGIVTRIFPEEGQVTIVDQAGTNRTLTLSNLRKVDTKATSGFEHDSSVFKAGDRVQVDSAQGPASVPATVLQVYRTIAFVRTIDTQEILARRFNAVHKLAAPAMQQQPGSRSFGGSGRYLIGKSVTIAGGTHKGYVGIVKDVINDTARVELHTNSKIISVPRDRVIPVDGSSSAGPSGPSGHRDIAGGKTPAWGTSKTPAWGATKTPAWNAQSGKTPAWNAQSGKTPAWNAQSGKTPAWNAQSGKTPAWNAQSGKTPAWNTQSGKTPTWQASTGRTPTWTSKTPVWSAPANPTAAASGWNSAATPAWNQSVAAPSGDDVPVWAQSGVLVRPKGATTAMESVESAAPGRVILANGQSYRPADLEPIQPGKKDRVRLLTAAPGEPALGRVIGLDGPDAVVRMDEAASFRVIPLQSLGKLQE